MKSKANIFQDPKTGILWISDYTWDETGFVKTAVGTLDLTKCKAVDAEFVSFHSFGLSLCGDCIVYKNTKGLYAVLAPFHATMGNGGIYASVCTGFEFKSVYGFADRPAHSRPTIYLVAENTKGKWGMISINESNNLWQVYSTVETMPFSHLKLVVPFEADTMKEALMQSNLKLSVESVLYLLGNNNEFLRDFTKPQVDNNVVLGISVEDMLETRKHQQQQSILTPTPTPAQTITTGGYTRISSIPFQVTFPDGTVIAEKNASKTFIATLQKIGLKKVQGVNIDVCGYNLVSDTQRPPQGKTKKWQDYVNGKYIYTKLGNAQKIAFLYQIADALGINLKIKSSEENDGITMPPTPQPHTQADDTKPTAKQPRKGKTGLRITLSDGTIIQEKQAKDTFIKAIKAAGPAKLLDRRIDSAEPVVSKTRHSNPNYARAQHPIEGGFLVLTQFSTKRKKELLEKIGKMPGINMNWTVEIV